MMREGAIGVIGIGRPVGAVIAQPGQLRQQVVVDLLASAIVRDVELPGIGELMNHRGGDVRKIITAGNSHQRDIAALLKLLGLGLLFLALAVGFIGGFLPLAGLHRYAAVGGNRPVHHFHGGVAHLALDDAILVAKDHLVVVKVKVLV